MLVCASVAQFLSFGIADNSGALDSGQCQVTKFISRIKSFLANARIDMVSPHQGATLNQLKSQELSLGVKSEQKSVLCSHAPPEGHGLSAHL